MIRIKYENGFTLLTPCPNGLEKNTMYASGIIMVGSITCQKCKNCKDYDLDKQWIECSYGDLEFDNKTNI